jgi:hypothetical protein
MSRMRISRPCSVIRSSPGLGVSDPDPSGGWVVTYNGWPLYTYRSDVEPGSDNGQDIDLNGGYWYVIRPSGEPVKELPGG